METIIEEKESLKDLYEGDEYKWLLENINLLKKDHLDKVDSEHLIEFLEDLAKRDKKEIKSRMLQLLSHLLKWKYQPKRRSRSWKTTIRNQRYELIFEFEESKTLKNFGIKQFITIYEKARKLTCDETGFDIKEFPEPPPFSFEQAMDEDYFPE